jgi:dephospho-CoA kinase
MSKFIVGLTGGIGSGKTAASDYFASLGITIVDADVVARLVVEPGQKALNDIQAHFGDDVINIDGTLNRRALRDIVFADDASRKVLESITHPAIAAEIIRQLNAAQSAYAILVSPLLLETSQHQLVQRILLIDVPEVIQIERTSQRDEVDQQQVKAIIAAQMSRAEKREKADDIVINDGSLAELQQQLDQLHSNYIELANTGDNG